MNSPIEQLIDGIDLNPPHPASSADNKSFTQLQSSNSAYFIFGIAGVLSNKSHCQVLLEKINHQAQYYIQSLKKLRSEINATIRHFENNLTQVQEHPFYLLFQLESTSQLTHVLADKIFIDSLSEKISEDLPAQELAKSIAIEIESKPILSGEDINEKLSKTALLKALVGIINQGDTPTYRGLATAAQIGQLSTFIKKLSRKEKQHMRILKTDAQRLESDNAGLKQAKTNVNQQLRQLRKQFKTIHQLHPNDTPIDLIQKSSKLSEVIQQSQQTLFNALSEFQLPLKGSLSFLKPKRTTA
ncbi:hypothetical protein [Legionella sp. W05-934-2]|jgi:rubrerythrin|uniref:hypothetical protein n=1 Tax=Legionella sp. W05-934-2 TaxID=1198649 RepID=UPI0034620B6C